MTKRRSDGARDRRIAGAVSAWFAENARELPWRTRRRDPYRSLVAEAMLQQTQVARVVEKYRAFVKLFPTVAALARADEHDVLAAWAGLGYYRRARNLHAAARMIVEEFGGRVPREVEVLRRLPGVGRYTAGAIASIAFGAAAPIVDGNVARVLVRIEGRELTEAELWARAESLVGAAALPGVFNEGLMELGARVCLPGPATPKCGKCPVREMCAARREGRQEELPAPKRRGARTAVYCASAIVQRGDGAILLERRASGGMWGGMWQGPTLERADRAPSAAELARHVGIRGLRAGETFEFLATHRRMVFVAFRARAGRGVETRRGEFVERARVGGLPMSSPQRRLLGLSVV